MSIAVSFFRQCALTLGQLCDSRVVLGILQNHCQDALWYRVPRDAPSYVDLGAYMFQQTDEYRMADTRNYRRVATIVSVDYFSGYTCINLQKLNYVFIIIEEEY